MYHRIDSTLRFSFGLFAFLFLYILYAGPRAAPGAHLTQPLLQNRTPPGMSLTRTITNMPSAIRKPGAADYYARLSGFNRDGEYLDPIGDTQFKEIALTFDIGNFSAGEYILNVLKEQGVRATIFLANNQSYKALGHKPNGEKILLGALEEVPQYTKLRTLLKRMVEDGHEVGNHTWSHHNWIKGVDVGNKPFPLSRALLHKELEMVNARFKAVTGKNLAPIWRSPFGACSIRIARWAKEAGYSHIFWSKGMDSLDWTDRLPARATLRLMLKNARPGGVYLFHLGNALRTRSDRIHHILRELIRRLKRRGYTLVTVTELLDGRRNSPAS